MELSIASLEWLVLGAGRELMLFASVGILLFGLDDLLFDSLWIATKSRDKPMDLRFDEAQPLAGKLAVFLPAWKEAAVLPTTLLRSLEAWEDDDFRIYVGCYPNDAATLLAVSPLAARDPRLRLVIGGADGPTTKGDNLNQMWAALCADERAEGFRVLGVILHDAEDHVHPLELALYRRTLSGNAMVQIPVVPFIDRGATWIGGHYCDEFAEAHGKEVVLRSRLGLPIPSAGVGCALARSTVALLAIERGGEPFRPDSLTEDYELGMLIGAYGLRARFIDAIGPDGDRIASRGAFPNTVETAVRQKSRWIAGIALAAWDTLGWIGRVGTAPDGGRPNMWLTRWMLWRDRRAPLAAIVILTAYLALLLTILGLAGTRWLDWRVTSPHDVVRALFMVNAMVLLWRLGMRGYFTARWYGMRQALQALPRAFLGNVIAILAARRAVVLYWTMLRSGRVMWDKTEHFHRASSGEAVPLRATEP